MPSESSDRRAPKLLPTTTAGGAPPPEQEQHLPCPRCDSTHTKFCYYNNYNFSQPRHFCKSCRRYWTHGGTLRDIPVGGGSRKSAAKRSRTSSSSSPSPSSSAAAPAPSCQAPVMISLGAPLSGGHGSSAAPFVGLDVMKPGNNVCGSYASLLNTAANGPGFLALGGFGPGFEEMGFGMNRGIWPVPAAGSFGDGGAGGAGTNFGGNAWHMENGEGGLVGGGDCFSWPDLAISTAGNVFK